LNAPIDHTNYEAWLLDRSEGNLSAQQERELDAFLALHPHLAPDELALPSVPMVTSALEALDKEALKRSIPPVGKVGGPTVEDHLIARLEGDLDQQQLEALRVYLALHPEWLQAERTYALTKLVPEAMAFAAKRDLERHFPPTGSLTKWTLDDHLIARLEGDLSADQERTLDRFLLQDKALERNWALVKATRIEATPVRFAGKEALKKREGRVVPITFGTWSVRMAAAASVAVLIAVGLWYLRAPSEVEERIARIPTTDAQVKEVPPVGETYPQTGSASVQGMDAAQTQGGTTVNSWEPRTTPIRAEELRPTPTLEPVHMPLEPAHEPNDTQLAEENAPANAPDPVIEPKRTPESVPEAAQLAEATGPVTPSASVVVPNERTLGDVLASALRERVLDTPERSATPLDGEDAATAVDRTLKVVGGARAGLDLERKAKGGINGFNLRLGRNLSISASR
jgi:hypothetical protein